MKRLKDTYKTIKEFIIEEIIPYIFAKNKKPLINQIKDMIVLYQAYKYIPYQYIKTGLYTNNNDKNLITFIPPKLIFNVQKDLNPEPFLCTVNNKVIFRKKLNHNNIIGINEIIYIDKMGIIFDVDENRISYDEADRLLINHGRDMFMKPVDGAWGIGARRVGMDEDMGKLVRTSRNRIIQPLIVQHEMMRSMNATSVNTVRIDTLLDEGRWVSSAAVLRIGVNGSVVDNSESSGLIVGVDLDTGRLFGAARQRAKFGPKSYASHPDSGFVFKDRILPHWELLRETVVRAAEAFRPLGSLGWDVAITHDGVVIIEANCHWGVNIMQTGWGGLGRTPVGRRARALHGLPPLP